MFICHYILRVTGIFNMTENKILLVTIPILLPDSRFRKSSDFNLNKISRGAYEISVATIGDPLIITPRVCRLDYNNNYVIFTSV